jgi:hypothetical protein
VADIAWLAESVLLSRAAVNTTASSTGPRAIAIISPASGRIFELEMEAVRMKIRRVVVAAVTVGPVASAVPLSADTQYVRCETASFGRCRECRVKPENRVELVRELSRGHKDDAVGAPDWARGGFTGFSPKTGTEFDITVGNAGRVNGTADGKPATGHITTSNRLHLGDAEVDINRESWGFGARRRDVSDNVIDLRKR